MLPQDRQQAEQALTALVEERFAITLSSTASSLQIANREQATAWSVTS